MVKIHLTAPCGHSVQSGPSTPLPGRCLTPACLQSNFTAGCQYIMLSPLPLIPVKKSTISQNPPATN